MPCRKIQQLYSIPAKEMKELLYRHFIESKDLHRKRLYNVRKFLQITVLDGIYTHGVNRFPRFIQYIKEGFVKVDAIPSLENKYGGIEQWNGNLGPGNIKCNICNRNCDGTWRQQNGIGCVALRNTNHWMRGGTYGWQAAKAGYVFIGWTNTIANMPAWGAKDARLGNNPLVMALPYNDEAIVLDMAMSQYSYGALELSAMKNEKLSVYGGFDKEGYIDQRSFCNSCIKQAHCPLVTGKVQDWHYCWICWRQFYRVDWQHMK